MRVIGPLGTHMETLNKYIFSHVSFFMRIFHMPIEKDSTKEPQLLVAKFQWFHTPSSSTT